MCRASRDGPGAEHENEERTHATFLQQLKNLGYRIELHYLWIPSAEFSARRVAARVQKGGHDVPRPVIRRRFAKRLKNLVSVYLVLADYAGVVDNSGTHPVPIMERINKRQTIFQTQRWIEIVEGSYDQED